MLDSMMDFKKKESSDSDTCKNSARASLTKLAKKKKFEFKHEYGSGRIWHANFSGKNAGFTFGNRIDGKNSNNYFYVHVGAKDKKALNTLKKDVEKALADIGFKVIEL